MTELLARCLGTITPPRILIVVALVFGCLIIRTDPIRIGGDEGIEFSKALIVARSPDRIISVWNDQPWFYSWVFGNLFRLTGFWSALPRGFSLLSALLFCALLTRFMPYPATPFHHACAITAFLTSPLVQTLSVSAMCELPATLLGMIGASWLVKPSPRFKGGSLLLGGTLFGCALQIKLTAGIVFIAATLAFVVMHLRAGAFHNPNRLSKSAVHQYLLWVTASAATFILIVWLSPASSFESLWTSHNRAGHGIPSSLTSEFSFHLTSLPLITTGIFLYGALWLSHRSLPGPWLLPVCYVVLSVAIHLFHKPFYGFYRLHFATGFAPIVGWVVGELVLRTFVPSRYEAKPKPHTWRSAAQIACLVLFSLWLGVECSQVRSEIHGLITCARSGQDGIIAFLEKKSPVVRWGFSLSSDSSVLAHSGVLIVPELIVLSNNRLWGGYLDEEGVIEALLKCQPDILLLPARLNVANRIWGRLLEYYRPALEANESVLYVNRAAKEIEPPTIPDSPSWSGSGKTVE